MRPVDHVVWHDLECGAYEADLPLWLELAAATPGPVLDIGAGTGRVAIPLARAGHAVHALDSDAVLLDALRARAGALPITAVEADACTFRLEPSFGLCIVPMQTIHLLADRTSFLRCAHAALRPGGVLAIALLGDGAEPFEMELEPERTVRAGVFYASSPTALRLRGSTMVLERRRARSDASGTRIATDTVRLATFGPGELANEVDASGFAVLGTRVVVPTEDRAGSIVMLVRAVGAPASGTEPKAQAATRRLARPPSASTPEKRR